MLYVIVKINLLRKICKISIYFLVFNLFVGDRFLNFRYYQGFQRLKILGLMVLNKIDMVHISTKKIKNVFSGSGYSVIFI